MRGMVHSTLGLESGSDVRWLDIVDLGCGLGQAGRHFRPLANRLVGLDVSKASVEVARGRGLYDEVVHADIEAELTALQPGSADLVLLSDVAPYFGDLEALLPRLVALLRPGAFILLNLDRPQTEECPSSPASGASASCQQLPYVLRPSGRWVHCPNYVEETFRNLGLEVRRTAVLSAQTRYRRGPDGQIQKIDRLIQHDTVVYMLQGR